MDKNTSISTEKAGHILWSAAEKGIDHLAERVLPKISEVLNLTYDEFDQKHIRTEAFYVCLWIATKALKEETDLIESIHNAAFCHFDNTSRSKKKETFDRRCEVYNESWGEDTGGNQSILCINILAEIFGGRTDQRELINFWAFIQLTNFVLSLKKAIVDLREKINIKN